MIEAQIWIDRISASLYYHQTMLASCQTFTVCCCTCCHTRVSSGTGRLLTY